MSQFKTLRASSLYCPKCQATQPVVEKLLLILPDREIYDYLCRRCATSIGKREVKEAEAERPGIILP
jgi:hypothetical protein